MEPAVIVARPSLLPLPAPGKAAQTPPHGFAVISIPPSTFFSGGGGGGRCSAGGGGGGDKGGGRGRDDDSSCAGAIAAAVAALGAAEVVEGDDPDAIVLHVGGMSCGGCAGKVKQILESQPEVIAATIDFEHAIAFVWMTPEAKLTKDWKKELGDKLANLLSACGFQSHLQDEGDSRQSDPSRMLNECP